MDSQFLEAYGRLLIGVAESRRQFDKFTAWLNREKDGTAGMEDLFRQCFGLTGVSGDTDDGRFTAAMESFRDSYAHCMKQMGWVPAADYEELKNKYESLKSQADTRQKFMEQLQTLMDTGKGCGDFMDRMQQLTRNQTEQFQSLMATLGKSSDIKS